MLARSLRMSDLRLLCKSNCLGFEMGLVAIICPICVHVGFTCPEQLPRVLTCSRCHHQQNFSRPMPRQRPTEGYQHAADGKRPQADGRGPEELGVALLGHRRKLLVGGAAKR